LLHRGQPLILWLTNSGASIWQGEEGGSSPRPVVAATLAEVHTEHSILWQSLALMGEKLVTRTPYLLIGAVLLLLSYIAGRTVRRLLRLAGAKTQFDPLLAELLGGLAVWISVILGLLVAAVVIFPTFRPGDLLAGLGITSVAIGFAFKDILQNWLAGVFILWRRPFQVGDQIRTKEHEGTVESINVRSTMLKTYDGERVVVPNSGVYTSTILVRTAYGVRRIRFSVGIGYGCDLEAARAVIAQSLRQAEGVLAEPPPLVHIVELAPSAVNFNVYFWAEAEQANVLRVGDRVATGIKLALDQAGIDIPYPHTVVLLQDAPKRG
jgi:small-conductance mechanosensitive channel